MTGIVIEASGCSPTLDQVMSAAYATMVIYTDFHQGSPLKLLKAHFLAEASVCVIDFCLCKCVLVSESFLRDLQEGKMRPAKCIKLDENI